jgi:glycosyltransferase involved in cell wall biosynthesis
MSHVLFALTGDVTRNSRALRQLRALADLGCQVTAVTFVRGEPLASEAPGVTLRPVDLPPGSGPRHFLEIHRQLTAAVSDLRADVYHASDLYTLPALATAARRHRVPLVFDSRELYAHVASTSGRPWVRLFWHLIQSRFVPRADLVFTVSDSIADRLRDTYRIPRPIVSHNVPARTTPVRRTDLLRRSLALPPAIPIVLHQGRIQHHRGCEALVEAFQHVPDAVLVFLGDGPLRPAVESKVRQLHLEDRVHFLDPVPPSSLLSTTASADIGVTLLEDTCLNHRFALPNKLFEYLQAGLPVLASDLPEIRRVVLPFRVGRTVDPTDLHALSRTLREMAGAADLRTEWGANTGRALETYSAERAFNQFRSAYSRLLSDVVS